METPSSVINDGFLLAALLRSPTIVAALQRELKQLYPNVDIEPDDIRSILCHEVFQERLMNDALLMEADLRLAKAQDTANNRQPNRPTKATGTFKAVPSKDAEEHIHDMWQDKIQSSGGG